MNGTPDPLSPPSSLSAVERNIFRDTIAAAPHLRPCDMVLLTRFCEITALSNHVAQELREHVTSGKPSRALSMQEALVRMLISLSRQLRLTAHARITPRTAARLLPEMVERPWTI